MNTKRLLCACFAAAALLITAMPAMANTATTTSTNVPFAFIASGKVMPAGEYVLGKNSENVMSVRHEGGAAALAIITNRVGPFVGPIQPKLIFIKKNGQYHLSEIYLSAAPGGEQIPVK